MKSHNPCGFIDIHSHLLPNLDDGPKEFRQCLAAAERYLAMGVESVIATPHWIQGTGWAPTPEHVRACVVETENSIRAAGIPLRIFPGMEISLTDFLCGHFSAADHISLADTDFFLIEFPLNTTLNAPTREGLRSLLTRAKNSHFIIAHPERSAIFQNNVALVRELVEKGMLTQVNISSILGYAGRNSQQEALLLYRAGLVHFLASDSHATPERMPPSPSEMTRLADLIGTEAVVAGLRDNPLRLLSGEAVPNLPGKAPDVEACLCPTRPKKALQSIRQLFRHH